MVRKPYNPVGFLERFVAVQSRAAMLIVAAAVCGVVLATFAGLQLHNDVTNLISETAIGGFFLLVGLELRRAFADGTLTGFVLKISLVAALGGMALPAIIFLTLAPAEARVGWVAVVATDIALASAVSALGGFRQSLRVILLAVAVLDDLGAVLALATTGKNLKLLYVVAVVLFVAFFAWSIRKFNLGAFYTIGATVLVVVLMLRAGLHPSLGAFAVGFVVPHFDPDNLSVAERVEERLHPWIAAVLLPAFVFLHTLIPIKVPTGAPANLVFITIAAIVIGKTVGIGGVLVIARRRLVIAPTEALAVGFAAAAALTVALIGVDATLADTRFDEVVSLGVLAATMIAVVLGVVSGRMTRRSDSL